MEFTTLSALAAMGILLVLWRLSRIGRREDGLPPGPPTVPILGNLLEMPTAFPHLKFTALARQYGPVMSLKVFSQTIIILSSPNAVRAIIEKANGQSQGRPEAWLVGQYAFQGETLTLLNDSEDVARLRRALTAVLTPRASLTYLPVLEAESCQMLYNLMTNPAGWYNEIKRYTFSNMLALTYGVRAPRWESPWVQSFFDYTHIVEVLLAMPSVPLMDLFPILRHIPERFSHAKQLATSLRTNENRLTMEALGVVRKRLVKGAGMGAVMEDVIQKQSEWNLTDGEVREIGGTLLIGGSDTTLAFLLSTLLLLTTNPDVQRRAHEEMDKVMGSDRLPTLDDINELPYLCALVKEAERLRPTLTIGVPHCMTEDVHLDGYVLPKGATVIYNSWGIGHDPALFPDPEKFEPERFLNDEHAWWRADKSAVWAFGGGRRMCIGMYFAKNAVYLAIARFLWAFEFRPIVDEGTGKPVEIDMMAYTEGVLPRPHEFPCGIHIRSDGHKKTIMQELQTNAISQLKLYEKDLNEDDVAYLAASRANLS